MNESSPRECALCRSVLSETEPRVTLTVGLNESGDCNLVEETHEVDFCARKSQFWPEGCAQKAKSLLDFFVERLWDLRLKDDQLPAGESEPTA